MATFVKILGQIQVTEGSEGLEARERSENKVLKETGWVQGESDGPCVCYCIIEGVMDYYLALMKRSL